MEGPTGVCVVAEQELARAFVHARRGAVYIELRWDRGALGGCMKKNNPPRIAGAVDSVQVTVGQGQGSKVRVLEGEM
jgi:hypothetical protein